MNSSHTTKDLLRAIDNILGEVEACADDCHNAQDWDEVSDNRTGATYWDRITKRIEEAKALVKPMGNVSPKFTVRCAECGADCGDESTPYRCFDTQREANKSAVKYSDWARIGNKFYCTDCFTYSFGKVVILSQCTHEHTFGGECSVCGEPVETKA